MDHGKAKRSVTDHGCDKARASAGAVTKSRPLAGSGSVAIMSGGQLAVNLEAFWFGQNHQRDNRPLKSPAPGEKINFKRPKNVQDKITAITDICLCFLVKTSNHLRQGDFFKEKSGYFTALT